MGNEVSSLGNESIDSFQWSVLNNRDLYLELSSPSCIVNKDLCKKVCQNTSKSLVLPTILKKIQEFWDSDFLCSNLMLLLKHFILFVYSEKIPYSFLFEDVKKSPDSSYESSFHRLVPVIFTFESINKTVYISVPQSAEFDRKREQDHMIETIRSHFPELNEHLLRNNEKMYLVDDSGKLVTIEEVFKHYNNAADTLVDPFKAQTKHFTVFRAVVKTMECDLASPMSSFVKEVVEKLLGAMQMGIFKLHSLLELILALLSSQLYWLDKPIGRIEYKLFKHSPVLDILMSLPPETSQMCSRVLLEFTTTQWKAETKSSLFSSLLSSYLDLRHLELSQKTPRLSGYLLLLLNAYGFKSNPFRIQSWEMKWEQVSSFLFRNLENPIGLSLFSEILKRNPSFTIHILSLSEPETFLEPLLSELYQSSSFNDRTCLILVDLLVLSKDKIFIKFINEHVLLSSVTWLRDFHIEKISLGSLMFLALIRVLRENLRNLKLDFVHVVTVACLFNISQSAVNLAELPSMELLALLKALYSRYCKLLTKDTSETGIFTDLIHLTVEVLARILHCGLNLNTNLVQAVLHHADLFNKLRNSQISNKNIAAVHDCIEHFMKHVDSENVMESIIIQCRTSQFSGYFSEILNCKEFIFGENFDKWEEFFVPHLWRYLTQDVFVVPNASRVVLFRHS